MMKKLCLLFILCTSTFAQQHDRDTIYMKRRAQRLMQEMNFSFAITHLERSIKLRPRDADLFMLYGECLFKMDRLEDAVQAFAQGYRLNPSLLPKISHYPLCLVRLARLDEARAIYETMAKAGTPMAFQQSAYGLGLIGIHEGNLKMARQHLLRALEYDPTSQKINFRLGYVKRQLGELKSARQHFLNVVARDALHEPALHNLALTCRQLGLKEEALKYKRLHSKTRGTLVTIGNLKRALALKAKDTESLAKLADIWYSHRLWNKAYGPYRALTVAYPHDPVPRFRMARCLFQKNDLMPARQQLEQVVRRWPNFEPARVMLADMNSKKKTTGK